MNGRRYWTALLVLAVLPYVPSLGFPLLYDDRTLLDNPWLAREAGPASVFAHDYWYGTRHAGSDLYRPVTILTLAWNLKLAGSRVGLRLVNVLLHALVTLAVASVLRGILRPRSHPLPFAAWVGAALFAVHPLGSESVLWAVGRGEILAAAFGLGAFALFVADRGDDSPRALRAVGGSLLFLLALLSKESALSFLVVGGLWLVLSDRHRSAGRRSAWTWGAGTLGSVLVYLLLRLAAVRGIPALPDALDNPLVDVGAATRIANAVLLLGRYVGKMLFPLSLSIDYGYAQIPVVPLAPWGGAAAAALVSVWLALLFLLRRRAPKAAFLAAFVPATFAVTGNFVAPIGTIFAERLAYLPLVGFCGLAGLAVERIGARNARSAIVALLVVATLARTVARGQDYRDLVTLTEATAAAAPRSVKALLNLGRVRLELLNRPAEAIEPLERALALAPAQPRVLRLLSDARARLGHEAETPSP